MENTVRHQLKKEDIHSGWRKIVRTMNTQKAVMSHLPEKQKEAVYLRFNEAMDYPEIAIILGITIESVRKQVYRALKTVRELLDNKSFTILFHFLQKKIKKAVHV